MMRRPIDTSVDGCARIRASLQCFVNEIGRFDACREAHKRERRVPPT